MDIAELYVRKGKSLIGNSKSLILDLYVVICELTALYIPHFTIVIYGGVIASSIR